jgi:septum formation protein
MSREDIETYLKSEEWRGKAGGYAIQGRAEAFVRELSGSHSGVIGLPLYETVLLLQGAGFPVYHHWMTQSSNGI